MSEAESLRRGDCLGRTASQHPPPAVATHACVLMEEQEGGNVCQYWRFALRDSCWNEFEGQNLGTDNVSVIEGEMATISCRVKNNDDSLRVSLSNVSLSDEGRYVCQLYTDPPQEAYADITVLEDVVSEGNETELTCTAMGSKPAASIRWMKGEQELTAPEAAFPITAATPEPASIILPYCNSRLTRWRRERDGGERERGEVAVSPREQAEGGSPLARSHRVVLTAERVPYSPLTQHN
ncbi:unnamed protein product, partial [Coregonus sp. 'balchen']